jgi:hypothetical protein
MRRRASAVVVSVAALLAAIAPAARASLTSSEAEQVRRGIATATDLGRVRALVARPDLSSDEVAAAVSAPLTTTPLDGTHLGFLNDLVFGDSSAPSRPVLAVATVRGVLARADALIAQHALDLERSPAALDELARAYGYLERIASAVPAANIPASAREQCARALVEHLQRNGTVLLPQVAVGPRVARMRAHAAIALLDFMPDAPTRRIDASDGLGLTGARRAVLVERGVLVLDDGSPDERVASLRTLLDRIVGPPRATAPSGAAGVLAGVEAIFVGTVLNAQDGLVPRDGTALLLQGDTGGASQAALLWGSDVRSPPGDGWTTAVARGLALRQVTLGTVDGSSGKDALRARIDRDGGVAGVAAMAAMLLIDGPLAVEVAAARLLAGRGESAACLSDAIGAIAAPAGATGPASVLSSMRVGPARTSGPAATELAKVALDPTGSAASFVVEGHRWVVERDASGAVVRMRRDGSPVTSAMLAAARP